MTARLARRLLARLLDRDDLFDDVAGAITDARDRAPRDPDDADSADVLEYVIATLRAGGIR